MKKRIIIVVLCIGIILLGVSLFMLYGPHSKKDNNTKTTTTTTINVEGKITITFDSDGGSTIEPMIVNKDEEITLPEPTKEDMMFSHWETEEGEIFVGESTFNKNTSLKAIWTEQMDMSVGNSTVKKKTIWLYVYDVNLKVIEKRRISIIENEDTIIKLNKYNPGTKEGYKFSRWMDYKIYENYRSNYRVDIKDNTLTIKVNKFVNVDYRDSISIRAVFYKDNNVTTTIIDQ